MPKKKEDKQFLASQPRWERETTFKQVYELWNNQPQRLSHKGYINSLITASENAKQRIKKNSKYVSQNVKKELKAKADYVTPALGYAYKYLHPRSKMSQLEAGRKVINNPGQYREVYEALFLDPTVDFNMKTTIEQALGSPLGYGYIQDRTERERKRPPKPTPPSPPRPNQNDLKGKAQPTQPTQPTQPKVEKPKIDITPPSITEPSITKVGGKKKGKKEVEKQIVDNNPQPVVIEPPKAEESTKKVKTFTPTPKPIELDSTPIREKGRPSKEDVQTQLQDIYKKKISEAPYERTRLDRSVRHIIDYTHKKDKFRDLTRGLDASQVEKGLKLSDLYYVDVRGIEDKKIDKIRQGKVKGVRYDRNWIISESAETLQKLGFNSPIVPGTSITGFTDREQIYDPKAKKVRQVQTGEWRLARPSTRKEKEYRHPDSKQPISKPTKDNVRLDFLYIRDGRQYYRKTYEYRYKVYDKRTGEFMNDEPWHEVSEVVSYKAKKEGPTPYPPMPSDDTDPHGDFTIDPEKFKPLHEKEEYERKPEDWIDPSREDDKEKKEPQPEPKPKLEDMPLEDIIEPGKEPIEAQPLVIQTPIEEPKEEPKDPTSDALKTIGKKSNKMRIATENWFRCARIEFGRNIGRLPQLIDLATRVANQNPEDLFKPRTEIDYWYHKFGWQRADELITNLENVSGLKVDKDIQGYKDIEDRNRQIRRWYAKRLRYNIREDLRSQYPQEELEKEVRKKMREYGYEY